MYVNAQMLLYCMLETLVGNHFCWLVERQNYMYYNGP